MRVPKRKAEENRKYGRNDDHFLSAEALAKLKEDLRSLQDLSRPRAVTDLSRAREMGDLSENAAYSEAKGRLFGIDRRIFEIKEKIKNAVVIRSGATEDGRVRIGARVVVSVSGKEKTYDITGVQETNPSSGRISYQSPLGRALMGRIAGESVEVTAATGKVVHYDIVQVI